MVAQFSALLSTVGKPIIVNGGVLKLNNKVVYVKRNNYTPLYYYVSETQGEIEISNGDDKIVKFAAEFNKQFNVFGFSPEQLSNFQVVSDSLTGAIIFKNQLYERLIDKDNKDHLYDGTKRFAPEVEAVLRNFVLNHMLNYYEIFYMFLSRRLSLGHMSMRIKAHMVSGLWQPYILKTLSIDTPLDLKCFSWIHSYLNDGGVTEVILETLYDTTRGMELTAVAMHDWCEKFHTPIIREMDRRKFMYTLLMVLSATISSDGPRMFSTRFSYAYREISNAQYAEFITTMNSTVHSLRYGINVK